jgi:maleate cis-trans isomerase
MIDYVPEKSNLLAHVRIDGIVFGCASGNFIKGIGYEKKRLKLIKIVRE